jgi:hypothetical protein
MLPHEGIDAREERLGGASEGYECLPRRPAQDIVGDVRVGVIVDPERGRWRRGWSWCECGGGWQPPPSSVPEIMAVGVYWALRGRSLRLSSVEEVYEVV